METEEFLLEDYKLKLKFVTDHLSRMWLRFNFLLTLNSALFAFSFSDSLAAVSTGSRFIVIVGVILSTLWYCFGAMDNFLVENYKRQVACSHSLLRELVALNKGELKVPPSYVGEVRADTPNMFPLYWRFGNMTAPRHLAVVMPLVFLILWVVSLGFR